MTHHRKVFVAVLGVLITTTWAAEAHGQSSTRDIKLVWGVLPHMVVRDSYGRHVSTKYFAIDIAILNQSPDTLNVTGFDVETTDQGSYPSLDWKLVRASIEKGQMTGRRNVSMAALKGTGSIAAGLNGFFKNARSAATYGRIVSAFTGPFITGLEALIPDTTIKYLANWDQNPVFKNGFVIEGNGRTGNGVIFIPIQLLFPEYRKPSRRDAPDYTPDKVRAKIKRINLIGQQIPQANITSIDNSRVNSTSR